jgi:hypothetical protein
MSMASIAAKTTGIRRVRPKYRTTTIRIVNNRYWFSRLNISFIDNDLEKRYKKFNPSCGFFRSGIISVYRCSWCGNLQQATLLWIIIPN